jgi:hypothetical protein
MGHSFASNFSMVYHSIIQYMIGSQVQLIVGQALNNAIKKGLQKYLGVK